MTSILLLKLHKLEQLSITDSIYACYKLTYAFKGKNGAVKLCKQGKIIVVILSGACGTSVINFYSEKLKVLAQACNSQPRAYLCNGKDFEAYCFDSPVGKAQTQQIMQDCGDPTDVEDVLFKTESEAETFLVKKLASIEAMFMNMQLSM